MFTYCYLLRRTFVSLSDDTTKNKQKLNTPPSSMRNVKSKTFINKKLNWVLMMLTVVSY